MTNQDDEQRSERETIIQVVRKTVWNGVFGVNAEHGACQVCASPIRENDFVIGHYLDGVSGGKAQVNNMRPICRACDKAMGKMSIEEYKRTNPTPQRTENASLTESKPDEKEKQSSNSRWFDAFTDALWYSDFDIRIPIDIKFPDIDLPNIDFPDFDFDFNFDS